MDTEHPISYYPLLDGQGLAFEEDSLVAYHNGQVVGSTEVDTTADLDFLLESYMVPQLLPKLSFCYTEPRRLVMSMNVDFAVPGTLFGSYELDGIRDLWRAECVRHGVFLHANAVPPGVRPWANNDEPGSGWQFALPPSLRYQPDQVIIRRAAVALEAFVYSLDIGREIELPYKRAFNNIFSAEKPMWSFNLPRIAEAEMSTATSLPV